MSGASRRRLVSLASLTLLAAIGAYLLFGPSEERRVLATLRELAAALRSLPRESEGVRHERVVSALERLTTPNVAVVAPEVGNVEGRQAVAKLLELARGIAIEVRTEQADVRIGDKRATATLLVAIVLRVASEERVQQRTVVAELAREKAGFVVRKLELSGVLREEPEARP